MTIIKLTVGAFFLSFVTLPSSLWFAAVMTSLPDKQQLQLPTERWSRSSLVAVLMSASSVNVWINLLLSSDKFARLMSVYSAHCCRRCQPKYRPARVKTLQVSSLLASAVKVCVLLHFTVDKYVLTDVGSEKLQRCPPTSSRQTALLLPLWSNGIRLGSSDRQHLWLNLKTGLWNVMEITKTKQNRLSAVCTVLISLMLTLTPFPFLNNKGCLEI